jgi:hypothetical protein
MTSMSQRSHRLIEARFAAFVDNVCEIWSNVEADDETSNLGSYNVVREEVAVRDPGHR